MTISPYDGYPKLGGWVCKVKHRLKDGTDRGLFGFVGLWERWTDKASSEVVRSCSIITTKPNGMCAPIHDRMPVIAAPEDYVEHAHD